MDPRSGSFLRWLGASAVAGILLGAQTALATSFGVNLIANGDAESDTGTLDNSNLSLTGWTDAGAMTAVQYGAPGGWPLLTDPGPVARGANFFTGGFDALNSVITQILDVSDISTLVDAGAVTYEIAGFFGGFSNQTDRSTLTATFLDAGASPIGSPAQAGPVTAADRGNATGLLFDTSSGAVPVNTRSIEIKLEAIRDVGMHNDGYADNLSLLLIPEPGTVGTLGLGLAVLAIAARRRSGAKLA